MTPRRLLFTGRSSTSLSEIGTFDRCPQMWAFSQMVDSSSRATGLGTLIHVGLAHRYAIRQAEQEGRDHDLYEPEQAIDGAASQAQVDDPNGDHAALARTAKAIYAAYARTYLFDRFKVLGVEFEIALSLTGKAWRPVIETGPDGEAQIGYRWQTVTTKRTKRVDLAYEAGGRVFYVDHKTAAEGASHRKVQAYSSDKAFHFLYLHGTLKYGAAFGGVIINFLQSVDPYTCKRKPVEPQSGQIRQLGQSVIDTEEQMAALRASGRRLDCYPRAQNELVCWHRYGKCFHYDRCKGE